MTTKEIKSRAKNALKEGSYWSGYGVNITTGFINSIIETILGIFFSFGMFGSFFNLAAKATLTTILTDVEATFNLLQSFLNQIKVLFLSGLILSLLLFVAKLLTEGMYLVLAFLAMLISTVAIGKEPLQFTHISLFTVFTLVSTAALISLFDKLYKIIFKKGNEPVNEWMSTLWWINF